MNMPAPLTVYLAEAPPFGDFLPFILIFAIFYFVVLRPASKQDKDRRKRVEKLAKGDQVVLKGGILGRISNMDDPTVATVEIADRVKVRVLKREIEDSVEAVLKAAEKGKEAPKKKAAPPTEPAKKEQSKSV